VNIKQKLIALFLFIGIIPTLVVGVVAYIALSNQLEKTTSSQLVSLAIKQEQKLNAMLQAKQEEVIKLANQFDFQVELTKYLATGSEANRGNILTILQNKKVEVPDIQSISVARLNGKVAISTLSGTEGDTLTDDVYTIAPDEDTAITLREDPRDGINKLYITTTLSVNKKESALMSAVFRTDDITAAVQDYTGLGTTGETVVAEKDGNGDAISLFPLRFDTDAALKTKLNSLNILAHEDTTQSQVTDYRGRQVIVAARSIGFADWVIATKMDKDEVLASIALLRDALIGIIVISSIIIGAIALYFGRFFTNPILDIARTSQRIGKGEFGARSSVQRNDEIGALASSINAMGLSLNEFVSDLESQRHRLEIILNSTVESILAIDKQGVIIIANKAAAELTHRNVSELVGQNIHDVFVWTHDIRSFAIDYDVPGANTYPDLEYINPAGGRHYVKLIVAKVSGEQEQKAAQTIITIHDETKSRELEDMKIDFVSMAAHELRTPLAALRGYLELISYKERDPSEEVTNYIRQALGSATELGGLINNLLDVTRIERGTLTLNMEKTDLATSVSKTVQDMSFAAEDRQLTLLYDGPLEGAFAFADPVALREVTNNLVSNAVKYTQPGGRIEVVLQRHDDEYVVSVKDTGIGIPKHALPNLFTKFYRVHGGLDSGSTGTGLGLFIAKSIIERHSGSIGVRSDETVGSTFTYTIPVFNEERKQAHPEQQAASNITRKHRGWITKNITR
jgi:PAS domain S-box-containing protein